MPQPVLKIVYRSIIDLHPSSRNARTHSKRQIKQIAASIKRFGFTNPVLIADDDQILAGHGRVEAARLLGLKDVPTVRLSEMTEHDRRAYVIADNKLALNAGWDMEVLSDELQFLIDENYEVELTGFSTTEVDLTLEHAEQRRPEGNDNPEDYIPPLSSIPVTRPGDLWLLGRHLVLCGDARDKRAYTLLMGEDRAQTIFTDPPYNVRVDGHVCGLGRIRHREFSMGAGEMSSEQFASFLQTTLGHGADVCTDGAIAFVCMDWRHTLEIGIAGNNVFAELKNICIWNKTNGGMGTFYRSKHEFVYVFKVGAGPHVNNFGLGDTGRYRTNVWDYHGVSSLHANRMAELQMHPTVKPVALVKDALLDCSKRGGIVLDMFGGSGTTLIAAEKCGRTARLIEFDPIYCDTIIRRYEAFTGHSALLSLNNLSFESVADQRSVGGE